MTDLERFRQETRAWLDANCPASMRTPIVKDSDICWGGRRWTFESEDQRLWLTRMAERGWTVPAWPKAYGGGGLDKDRAKLLKQEMTRIGARPPLYSFGVAMLGPALLKYGSEQQKQTYLPPIARGEVRWCQGYSEPNAGSDLANLQTRAEDRGDHFLINGQKVWASYADESDWIFCLVRTRTEGKKQAGISFILFDMESAGVRTKPIRLISGASPFCEIFFEDVKVPKQNLVGDLNAGWMIAKYLLTHEREMIGGFGLGGSEYQVLGPLAASWGVESPVLRAEIAQFDVDSQSFSLTLNRFRDEAQAGQSLGAASSFLKYYGTELNKRRYELLVRMQGHHGLVLWDAAGEDGELARAWLRSKANSIEGGTSEIQLNIIAKHILGLPG